MPLQNPKCEVRTHGNRQLELKIWYPVRSPTRHCYDLNIFFFTPSYLQIDGRRYGVDSFLEDLRANTRLSTPTIPLSRVVDPTFELSPLTRINNMLDAIGSRDAFDQNRLLNELRTLVNVYRVELRSVRRLIRDGLNKATDPDAVVAMVRNQIDDSERLLAAMRETGRRFLDPHLPGYLRTAMEWTDESMSLTTEIERFKLYHVVSKRASLAEAAELLEPYLDRERAYRRKRRLASWVNPKDDMQNEELLYRESTLKKWSQSVMYMSRERSAEVAGVGHVLAGIAAAAAMSFAIVATLLAQRFFASYSVPWALLIVVSYIFKDRIKVILRGVLARLLPGLVIDDAGRLYDPASGKRAGKTRSDVRFRSAKELPRRITDVRNSYPRPFSSILPPENVIHYHRRIRLNGRLLQKSHSRLESVTEILRLKLDTWLEEMDTPENTLFYVSGKKIKSVTAARVYHVNMIVSLANGDNVSLRHYRLILTREGLRRIEPVGVKLDA